jgi:hypothetical protein
VSDQNATGEFQLPTDLVIESHTDSEAEIRAAYDVPETKDAKPETKAAAGETDPPVDDTTAAPKETAAPAVVRRSKALTRQEQIQADINALTRTKHETARETEAAKRELAELQTQLAAAKAPPAAAAAAAVPVPAAAAAATPAPKVSDYEDLDEWSAAVAAWSTEEAERRVDAKRAVTDAATEKQTAIAAANESRTVAVAQYLERGEAFKADHPDYDDVVTNNQDIQVSGVMEVAILTSEHSAAIAYYLGSHPDEAAQLAAETKDLDDKGLAFVRRTLEARIARSDDTADPHGAAHPVTGTAPAARTTTTPRPFSPVASGAAASTKRLDQLSPDEYFAQRNKTELEKNGRL